MLYILNGVVFLIWASVLIYKNRPIDWHKIIGVYSLTVLMVDIPEIIFFRILELYIFQPGLLMDYSKDAQLGIILSDGVILPLSGIIFYYYLKPNQTWKYCFLLALLHIVLEFIYVQLGFLRYQNWSLIYSGTLYLLGFRVFAYLAEKLQKSSNAVPFWTRLAAFSYPASSWWGSLFSGTFLDLYHFQLGLFEDPAKDDRIVDLGVSWLIVLMNAGFIAHLRFPTRIFAYMFFGVFLILIAVWMNWKGFLIYVKWNHVLMALRYIGPFALIAWYDYWETVNKKS